MENKLKLSLRDIAVIQRVLRKYKSREVRTIDTEVEIKERNVVQSKIEAFMENTEVLEM